MERPIFKVTCQAKGDKSLWPYYVKINDGGLLMLLMLLMLLNVANVTHGGGYDLESFDEIEAEKYKCAVCKNVLKNAIQYTLDSNVPLRACYSCYTANTR